MEAHECLKLKGLVECKKLIDRVNIFAVACDVVCDPILVLDIDNFVSYNDLKKLVESHELFEKYESLDEAKAHLERIRFCIATKTWFGKALLNWSMYADKLEQAVSDVESCSA